MRQRIARIMHASVILCATSQVFGSCIELCSLASLQVAWQHRDIKDTPVVYAGQGQAADSKYSLKSAEKRDIRTKRREQRHSIDAIPARHAPARNSGLSSPAVTVSSPTASQSRTFASAPAGGAGSLRARAPSARSRLAAQSGLSDNAADDSDQPDDQDDAAVPVQHADTEQKAALTGLKRKRQQQQVRPAVKTASPARATHSAAAHQQSEQDAKTEQSRSSDAATPSEMNPQRAQAQSQAARRAAQHAQHADKDSVNEPASDSLPSVRRTGRQRKLTAAAAAAIEEFPSLYQQPARPPASGHKGRVNNLHGNSASSDEQTDWQGRSSAVAKASKRTQSKQAPAQETASNGVSTVQLSQLVRYGILPAGRHEFVFRQRHACEVEVLPDGEFVPNHFLLNAHHLGNSSLARLTCCRISSYVLGCFCSMLTAQKTRKAQTL